MVVDTFFCEVSLIEGLFSILDKQGIPLTLYKSKLCPKLIKGNFGKTDRADVFAFLNAVIAHSNIWVLNYHMFTLPFVSG